MTFNREARERFLAFAGGRDALWTGNFRDFNAAVPPHGDARLGRPDHRGRSSTRRSRGCARRGGATGRPPGGGLVDELLGVRAAEVDPFDRVQLEEVLRVCRSARSLSDAGRTLFAVSRTKKSSSNDADRLRKYLARYGLDVRVLGASPR